MVPEEDLQNQRPAATARAAGDEPEVEGSSERLSVFEDFLQNLDLDNLENSSEDDEPDEDDPKPKK